jgi:hypothetical protein
MGGSRRVCFFNAGEQIAQREMRKRKKAGCLAGLPASPVGRAKDQFST